MLERNTHSTSEWRCEVTSLESQAVTSEAQVVSDLAEHVALSVKCAPWTLYSLRRRLFLLGVLFTVCAASFFDYSILSVALEPIKHEFRVSDKMLGLLTGLCFAVVYGFAGIPIARLADRGNRNTIISCALAGWSFATMLCGFAQSFGQLAIARFFLGLTEPGALPPAQSLIADYFPPGKRATAIALMNQGGSAVGWLSGVAVGGYLIASYGWRSVFVVAGAAGLGMAAVARACLAEPRLHLGFPICAKQSDRFSRQLSALRGKPTFNWIVVGVSAYSIFSYGVSVFLPAFMMRSLNASLEQVSVTWGVSMAAANVVGAVSGGWLGDQLSRRTARWYVLLPAISCSLALPTYFLALRSGGLFPFIVKEFCAEAILSIGLPSAFAAVHVICGRSRRAMAIAILLVPLTLLGTGLGPLISGVISDALRSSYGNESLRYSLMVMVLFLVPASAAFWLASRSIVRDTED